MFFFFFSSVLYTSLPSSSLPGGGGLRPVGVSYDVTWVVWWCREGRDGLRAKEWMSLVWHWDGGSEWRDEGRAYWPCPEIHTFFLCSYVLWYHAISKSGMTACFPPRWAESRVTAGLTPCSHRQRLIQALHARSVFLFFSFFFVFSYKTYIEFIQCWYSYDFLLVF